MLSFERRRALVVWTAAIVCCCCCHMAMLGLPAAMAETEVAKEDVAGFLDEVLNQPYRGERADDLPVLARMALTKYATDNKVRRRAKTGLLATGATGIALAGLAPVLRELGRRKEENIFFQEQRGELPRGGMEKSADGSGDGVGELPSKTSSGAVGRRVRDFFVGPRANWGGRLWKASGIVGGLLLLAGIGLCIAKRNASRRIVENRRKYRKVLNDEMREKWQQKQQQLLLQLAGGTTGEQQEPQSGAVPPPGFSRPAFPGRTAMDAALHGANDVVQAVTAAAAAAETTGGGAVGAVATSDGQPGKPQQPQQSQKAAGGVFIGADAEADTNLSDDDVKRIIEIAKELRRPAVFYP